MYANYRKLREFEHQLLEHKEVRETQHRTEQQHISWELTLPSTSAQSSLSRITDSQPVRTATHYRDHSPSTHTVRTVSVTVQFSRLSDRSFPRSSSSYVALSGRQFLCSSRQSGERLPSLSSGKVQPFGSQHFFQVQERTDCRRTKCFVSSSGLTARFQHRAGPNPF